MLVGPEGLSRFEEFLFDLCMEPDAVKFIQDETQIRVSKGKSVVIFERNDIPRPFIGTSAKSSREIELARVSRHALPVVPRAGGDPVRRGFSVQSLPSLEYWIVRPSAQLRTRRTMTTECEFTISRRIASELCIKFPVLLFRGRREDRVHAAPAVPCAICA